MYDLKHFYEDFVGNGEVQESQSKVKELQHKLNVLIDRRSACELELIEVKKQLAELNSTQQTVSRGDAQYIELLKQEFKLYSEKQRLDGLLEVLNTEHQLLLMQLTHAFNDVHTKERQEANNVRLVKLFFATLVAVLGFATNAAYNHYKDARVQNHMNMQSQMMMTVVEFVEQEQSRNANKPSTESWGSYLYRQPGRLYGYLFPNQTNESWGSYLQRQPRLKQPAFGPHRTVLIRCFADRAKTTTIDSATQDKDSFQYYTIPSVEQEHKQGTHKQGSDVALRRISLIDLAKSKLYEAQSFYDEFSGMHEVKIAQNKVIEIQDQLQLVQERRRHILLELTLVRKQLQDIHIELQKATRGEHRYVELIRQEFDVLAREKEKNQIFQIIDQEERDLFSHLTAAVKTSHEKERTQANNVKYWSIIASGVGALLGIVATSINYYFRNTQFETIRNAAEESNRKLAIMEQKLTGLETSLARMNVEWNRYLGEKRIAEQRRAIRSPAESWGGYIRRHLGRFVRVFIPKG
uniref:Uncharacterized protein n=1 Tax=Anopheles culicifacies TaxID=139723 RepID=A0A182MNA7_9DIPT